MYYSYQQRLHVSLIDDDTKKPMAHYEKPTAMTQVLHT